MCVNACGVVCPSWVRVPRAGDLLVRLTDIINSQKLGTRTQLGHTTPHALTQTGGCLYSFVYYSWRWTRTVSETCRVILNPVKQKLHLVGYLLTRYFVIVFAFLFISPWRRPNMWPKQVAGHLIIKNRQYPIAHLLVLILCTFLYSRRVIVCIWQNISFGFFQQCTTKWLKMEAEFSKSSASSRSKLFNFLYSIWMGF